MCFNVIPIRSDLNLRHQNRYSHETHPQVVGDLCIINHLFLVVSVEIWECSGLSWMVQSSTQHLEVSSNLQPAAAPSCSTACMHNEVMMERKNHPFMIICAFVALNIRSVLQSLATEMANVPLHALS